MQKSQFKTIKVILLTWLLVALTLSFASASSVGLPINTITEASLVEASVKFEYFEDTDKTHNLKSIIKLSNKHWTKAEESNVSFGFSHSQFWLRLHINNVEMQTKNLAWI